MTAPPASEGRLRALTAIVPARNEADRIADTVRALGACPVVGQVVVIDDGSRDDTAHVATEAGAAVHSHPRRFGKGAAMQSGIGLASLSWVAFIDGDLAKTAGLVSTLADPVLAGEADVAIAVMSFPGGLRGMGIVMGLSRWAVRRWGGIQLQNPLCGQRVMSAETARRLAPLAPGYAVETRSAILFGRLGLRVAEVPLELEHRRSGRNLRGILHRGAQFRDVLVEVFRWALVAPHRREK